MRLSADVDFVLHNNFYVGWTEDISVGGLFLATYEMIPVGTDVELSFSLPNGHHVEVVGEVRWQRLPEAASSDVHPGVGVQFKDLKAEDLKIIKEFMALRSPLFFD
jgi:uncharacterized protein (TIGR02266 family)